MTQAIRDINCQILRTKRMKSLHSWVQYFHHILENPIIVDLNKVMFNQLLYTFMYRSDIIKNRIRKSKDANQYAQAQMGITHYPLTQNNGNLPLLFFGGNYPTVLLDNI